MESYSMSRHWGQARDGKVVGQTPRMARCAAKCKSKLQKYCQLFFIIGISYLDEEQ